MFLKELDNVFHKILFMELSCLVIMAEGSITTTAKEIKESENHNSFIKPYAYCIDENKLKVLREYAKDLDSTKNNLFGSSFSKFLNEILKDDSEYYTDYLDVKNHLNIFLDSGMTYKEHIEWGDYPALGRVIKQSVQNVLTEYKENTVLRQVVMQKLIEDNVDLLTLDQNLVQKSSIQLPEIKKLVLKQAATWLVSSKKDKLNTLSNKDKKIILCELIAIGLSNGRLEDLELSLLKEICILLGIDVDYLSEFKDVMESLLKAKKELNYLLNE